jgi:hypothetical protein
MGNGSVEFSEYLFIGWRQIGDACGHATRGTLKRYMKEDGLPIRFLSTGRPVITRGEILKWVRGLSRG